MALVAVSFSSCNITREPKATPLQKPFETLADIQMNRDAVYMLLRGVETPNILNYPDYQGDLYHVNIWDNNTILPIYAWQRQSMANHDFIISYYGSYYKVVMQANYFLMRAQEMLDNPNLSLTDNDKALIKQYMGELKVIRALGHWRLIMRFSKPWDGTTDNNEQNGIILITNYDPLTNSKAEKATRAQVYAQIMKDLDEGIEAIPQDANKEVKPSIYINRDYAYAMKARAALTSQNWAVAKEAARKVMDNYPLTVLTGDRSKDIELLNKIWRTEDSDEIVVRLYTTPQIGKTTASKIFGASWTQTYASEDPTDPTMEKIRLYMPSVMLEKWVIDLYQEEDLRKECYIKLHDLYLEGLAAQGIAYWAIMKFAGNKALDKDPNIDEWSFGVHLFNAAEAYLIYAEACYNLGDMAGAIEALDKLQTSRGITFEPDLYSDPAILIKEIKNERVRELVGEGWRFNDIVRWGENMKRGEVQQEVEKLAPALKVGSMFPEAGRDLEKQAGDQMFIWEFPRLDLENNPNLKAHKNWN